MAEARLILCVYICVAEVEFAALPLNWKRFGIAVRIITTMSQPSQDLYVSCWVSMSMH